MARSRQDIPRLPQGALPALGMVVLLVFLGAAARHPLLERPARLTPSSPGESTAASAATADATLTAIDALLAAAREAAGVERAPVAADLTVMRRLWLALAGTIPSLEEIRRFEADDAPGRVDRALGRILRDRRSADSLARRLASPLVGDDNGQFIVFRRDQFTSWLAEQIHANRPWDEIVRRMVAARGLWTDTPAVNFVTQAATNGVIDPDKLAGRVSRVFLGTRMDCAQCHDHPFGRWKQHEFEGLAAWFAQARLSVAGVEDDARRVHHVSSTTMAAGAGPMTGAGRNVSPRVPFGAEWLGTGGTHREKLAGWISHPENRRFDRAIANRAWEILFGRAWHEPVDDLPDPAVASNPAVASDPADLLDRLAADFREHGRDLRRLFTLIASTETFRLSSTHPLLDSPAGCDRVAAAWAAFPLTRLSPDQMIGAMVATTSLQTIDRDSHLVTRTVRLLRQTNFLREYGRVQDSQGRSLPATVPQALVQMNGTWAREMVEANAFTATGRIAGMAGDHAARLELAFLVALTRRPSQTERTALLPLLEEARTKGRGVEDVAWTLLNCPEFCWNH